MLRKAVVLSCTISQVLGLSTIAATSVPTEYRSSYRHGCRLANRIKLGRARLGWRPSRCRVPGLQIIFALIQRGMWPVDLRPRWWGVQPVDSRQRAYSV
jgi:hypothetical protein